MELKQKENECYDFVTASEHHDIEQNAEGGGDAEGRVGGGFDPFSDGDVEYDIEVDSHSLDSPPIALEAEFHHLSNDS